MVIAEPDPARDQQLGQPVGDGLASRRADAGSLPGRLAPAAAVRGASARARARPGGAPIGRRSRRRAGGDPATAGRTAGGRGRLGRRRGAAPRISGPAGAGGARGPPPGSPDVPHGARLPTTPGWTGRRPGFMRAPRGHPAAPCGRSTAEKQPRRWHTQPGSGRPDTPGARPSHGASVSPVIWRPRVKKTNPIDPVHVAAHCRAVPPHPCRLRCRGERADARLARSELSEGRPWRPRSSRAD